MAAKAICDRLFQQRIVKEKKTYSRKIKHRKGEREDHTAPLFVFAFSILHATKNNRNSVHFHNYQKTS